MVRPVLFDLDRTLVDVQSFTDYERAVVEVRRALGDVVLAETPETGWRSATREAMGILVALADRPEQWQLASDLIERHEQAAVAASQPMPGLDDVRRFLPGRRVAVVTLMGPSAARDTLDRHDIQISHVVGRRVEWRVKPAPDQVQAGLRLLGAGAGDAVMIGDSSWDQGAALAAGVEFIGLTNGRPAVEFADGIALVDDLTEVVARLDSGI